MRTAQYENVIDVTEIDGVLVEKTITIWNRVLEKISNLCTELNVKFAKRADTKIEAEIQKAVKTADRVKKLIKARSQLINRMNSIMRNGGLIPSDLKNDLFIISMAIKSGNRSVLNRSEKIYYLRNKQKASDTLVNRIVMNLTGRDAINLYGASLSGTLMLIAASKISIMLILFILAISAWNFYDSRSKFHDASFNPLKASQIHALSLITAASIAVILVNMIPSVLMTLGIASSSILLLALAFFAVVISITLVEVIVRLTVATNRAIQSSRN